eukprot:5552755-Alexandrium_andersonii.AAC.2
MRYVAFPGCAHSLVIIQLVKPGVSAHLSLIVAVWSFAGLFVATTLQAHHVRCRSAGMFGGWDASRSLIPIDQGVCCCSCRTVRTFMPKCVLPFWRTRACQRKTCTVGKRVEPLLLSASAGCDAAVFPCSRRSVLAEAAVACWQALLLAFSVGDLRAGHPEGLQLRPERLATPLRPAIRDCDVLFSCRLLQRLPCTVATWLLAGGLGASCMGLSAAGRDCRP